MIEPEKYSKRQAEMHLRRWAHEMAGGEGKANLIARLREGPGGVPEWSTPPGGLFSPQAEKTDQLLKDIHNFDECLYRALLNNALGLTLRDMERNGEGKKSSLYDRQCAAFGAFRMGLYIRR